MKGITTSQLPRKHVYVGAGSLGTSLLVVVDISCHVTSPLGAASRFVEFVLYLLCLYCQFVTQNSQFVTQNSHARLWLVIGYT